MLDKRTTALLDILLQSSSVTNKTIQETLGLSRRQVDYAISKLNDWLELNGYPPVQKDKGRLKLDEQLKHLKLSQETKQIYIPSETERVQLILLAIAAADDYISLEHLIQMLEVSKNTILRDMKQLTQLLGSISIEYSRQKGYFLSGDETAIRQLMMNTINQLSERYELNQHLMAALAVEQADIDAMINRLSVVESILERRFADKYFSQLPYHLISILKRISNGTVIEESMIIDYGGISDTKEYEASETLLAEEEVNEMDRLYITLQLLSTPIHSKQIETASLPRLKSVIEQCVENFEKLACINLSEKAQLGEKLYTHIKPAYFRIRYKLTTNYGYLNELDDKYQALFAVVKESFQPLEEFFECPIPDQELMLITLFFGGSLIEAHDINPAVVRKAVVVCPNGITMSRLLERTLIRLLPEIYFEGVMSVRSFEEREKQYDFVFSQVPLNTTLNVIHINDLQSSEEQMQLRRRVISELYHLPNFELDTDQLVDIIGSYADIKDKDGLKKELYSYFSEQKVEHHQVEAKYGLDQTLPLSRIAVTDQVQDFHQAIDLASEQLLEQNIISAGYIEKMKSEYQQIEPHILLRGRIAIPHAEIEAGSNDLGISMLKVNEGIPTDFGTIYFVCVIAAKDKEAHLESILQLINMAEDEETMMKLEQCKKADEIYQTVMQHITIKGSADHVKTVSP